MAVSPVPSADCSDRSEPLIPINKVPEFLNVSPPTRWRWALSGELECVRLGRRLFTTAAAVRRFLDARRVVPRPPNPPPPSLRSAERAAATAEARRRLGLTSSA